MYGIIDMVGDPMYRIAIVEDTIKIRDELSEILKKHAYDTFIVEDFSCAKEDILKHHCHLVLLDLNLTTLDGNTICKELRQESSIPIIIVTSNHSEMEELMSMHIGADDFIAKPYNVPILLIRIQNLLKRAYEQNDTTKLYIQHVCLDTNKYCVSNQNQSEELTKNEFRILYHLFQSKNKIVSREELMSYLWNSNVFIDDNALTVNMNRLRKKLDNLQLHDFIQTKRGLGYVIYED